MQDLKISNSGVFEVTLSQRVSNSASLLSSEMFHIQFQLTVKHQLQLQTFRPCRILFIEFVKPLTKHPKQRFESYHAMYFHQIHFIIVSDV